MGEENQSAEKLINTIATSQPAANGGFSFINRLMEALKRSHSAPGEQLLLGARLVVLEAQQIQLMDLFLVSKTKVKKLHENALDLPSTDKWFETSAAWTAKPEASSRSGGNECEHITTARELLLVVLDFCSKLSDNSVLKKRLEDMVELYKPRHEQVTPEELASIRSATVTGPHGMATHSGHW
ncbi:nfx1-type zinc finger-containing protein 1 [Fusarium langsethiae]|uniref:Nfx1-type zinc finger-containing protein 1 n=1 Tax=Fusarium langsethiae TaxID=179993 RepID=A0A0N0DET6_FUSLA|nr:nfx1-type zinc finger-containing protein 1 [Fusarium langsethiae]GKU03163.1 unnamed protein product [Fusarium langsethiae]GKU20871.1 unnamed protein product [Fusarium langsethiae]